MKTFASPLIILLFALIPYVSFSQEQVIDINNTDISVPDIYDFGEISDRAFTKFIIKNNRNSAVTVSEILTPAGFFANISEMTIASDKKVILYIGLDPTFVEKEGNFEEKFVIKTNLIMDIEIKVKGHVKK